MMDWHPSWLWGVLGATLMSAELLMPGVYLLWIGLAALLTAPLVWALAPGLEGQLLVFAVLCLVLVAVGWRLAGQRGRGTTTDPNTAALDLHGERGTISAPGRVAIRDGTWAASPRDLPVGTRVIVTARRGLVLEVAPLERQRAEPPG